VDRGWWIVDKVKLTKGELKRQRDALGQFRRYLPTLQLKKQQLQLEIVRQLQLLNGKKSLENSKKQDIEKWSKLLAEPDVDLRPWIKAKSIITDPKNIAGVELSVFKYAEFDTAEYDLFLMPLWVDRAIDELRELVSIVEEITIIEKGVELLRQELRITTQRVNLFEKVKIPDAEEAIRLIKIYIGDQMANAVGRSKIAKRKIESAEFSGVAL